MKLSVIIPTFNRAELLPRALQSVLSQELPEYIDSLEVIVVDDGSDDQTEKLLTRQFPQVNYIKQTQSGVSSARNRGLEAASGEWIALLDSDDEWLPKKLVRQFDVLLETGLQVCHTEEIWIRNGVRVNQMKKHQKAGGWIFQKCLPLCAISPSSVVIHKSVFDRIGVFDEQLPACEDYDLWLRLCAVYEVAYVETPCINKYGGHDDQLSRQFWGMDRFRVLALEKILQQPLAEEQHEAALAMLEQKLAILLAGAHKHANLALQRECEELRMRVDKSWGVAH
ncbi:MAG: glycosyltransferase family A protein [Pseudomonadota bacterium]